MLGISIRRSIYLFRNGKHRYGYHGVSTKLASKLGNCYVVFLHTFTR